jgi:hypothetical protein
MSGKLAAFVASLALSLFLFTGSAIAGFGFQSFEYSANEAPPLGSPPGTLGATDAQAGSHPWELSASFTLNGKANLNKELVPDGDFKDIEVDPPLGLVGNPGATPKCSMQQFTTPPNKAALPAETSYELSGASCPDDSQVGVAALSLSGEAKERSYLGIYNLAPPPGVPAEFGINYLGAPILFTASVRDDGSYGLAVHASDISQTLHLFGIAATLWGVPAEASHNEQRGECLGREGQTIAVPGGCLDEASPTPFLTLPTSCSAEPPAMYIRADPWQEPGVFAEASAVDRDSLHNPVDITGCEHLDFSPSLTILPQTDAANSPTGLEADLKLPQNANPNGLAESQLKDVRVTLPPGLVVNPAGSNGREACTPAEIDLDSQSSPTCPNASMIGSAFAQTPLLEEPLQGAVYLAAQENNPFGSLLAIYVVLHGDGVWVKLAGEVQANPTTGQLTALFGEVPSFEGHPAIEGTPRLPFNELKLDFFSGPRASLMTPGCGEYTAGTLMTPWSGTAPVSTQTPAFKISTGCGGGFAPGFTAGTVNNQAGAFSPFVVSISRTDQDQDLGQITVQAAPGLLPMVSKVPLCGAAQAEAGTCPPASQIGHLNVSVGAGSNPVSLPQPGKQEDPVYLTGPYKGGPFGLTIVAHAEAGPDNLGQVVVRAAIYVNPITTQVTVVSDPLPTILRGIPLDIRSATVTVDRPEFMFNPTNCERLAVTGAITSTQGVTADVSNSFQAANCAKMPFDPAISVSTSAKTSRLEGASLYVKIDDRLGDAVAGKVKVVLPKQLPARLSTLQKACPAAVFEANPASCPADSLVGFALASTLPLANPVSGPAYFVSHGGTQWPELVVVLQGENITVDLHGETFISKSGVTSSTFGHIPDVPLHYFEITLPESRYSALGAIGNLCKSKLAMPNEFVGENGVVINRSTPVTVTGCPKDKPAKKHKPRAKHRKHARRV